MIWKREYKDHESLLFVREKNSGILKATINNESFNAKSWDNIVMQHFKLGLPFIRKVGDRRLLSQLSDIIVQPAMVMMNILNECEKKIVSCELIASKLHEAS